MSSSTGNSNLGYFYIQKIWFASYTCFFVCLCFVFSWKGSEGRSNSKPSTRNICCHFGHSFKFQFLFFRQYLGLGYTHVCLDVHRYGCIYIHCWLSLRLSQQNSSNWRTRTIPYHALVPDILLALHLSELGYCYYFPWEFEDLLIYLSFNSLFLS